MDRKAVSSGESAGFGGYCFVTWVYTLFFGNRVYPKLSRESRLVEIYKIKSERTIL